MDHINFFDWFWWVLGIVLLLAEFIFPGLIVMFIGLSSLTVALLNYYEIVPQVYHHFMLWFSLSILYCFSLRFIVIKLYPGDFEIKNTIEDVEAIGTIVEVLKDVTPNKQGRIRYSGTTWSAKCLSNEIINSGTKAEIIGRENLTFIIKHV